MKASFASHSLRRSALALSIGLVVGGCTGGSSTDAGDGASDVQTDAQDREMTDVFDAAIDAADATDASDDANADTGADTNADTSDSATDAGDDGGTVSFMAMAHVTTLAQNCMPEVSPDPLTATGTVDLSNIGTATIGPITATGGAILTESGTQLATFTIAPLTIPAIAPGATGSAMFTKDTGSLMPANACGTVACSSAVRVAIDISGPNIPTGTRAISAISIVSCSF